LSRRNRAKAGGKQARRLQNGAYKRKTKQIYWPPFASALPLALNVRI
jgi:hypothetical protein